MLSSARQRRYLSIGPAAMTSATDDCKGLKLQTLLSRFSLADDWQCESL